MLFREICHCLIYILFSVCVIKYLNRPINSCVFLLLLENTQFFAIWLCYLYQVCYYSKIIKSTELDPVNFCCNKFSNFNNHLSLP